MIKKKMPCKASFFLPEFLLPCNIKAGVNDRNPA
jgi:hypothetical protein